MNQLLKVDTFRKGKTTPCKSSRFDVTRRKLKYLFPQNAVYNYMPTSTT